MQGDGKIFVAMWHTVFAILAFGSFLAGSKDGDWAMFWTFASMLLIYPAARLFTFLYLRTDAGRRYEAEQQRIQTRPQSVFEQSAKRSTALPAPGPVPVRSSQARKPGNLLHPTPENFEEYCTSWCIYLGYRDAEKTQNSRDGGIDIKSPNMIAQVKFQVSPVGVKAIRELNGVRRPGQEVLFFALNGFTPEARREAAEMNITLIRVSPLEGQIDILA